ncbi:18992_t:CDS:2, partial [Rhizophagus irregularis]
HEWMCKGGLSVTEGGNLKKARISEDNMVYEEIDRLIVEYEKENLEELGDDVEIVCN